MSGITLTRLSTPTPGARQGSCALQRQHGCFFQEPSSAHPAAQAVGVLKLMSEHTKSKRRSQRGCQIIQMRPNKRDWVKADIGQYVLGEMTKAPRLNFFSCA